MTILGLSGYAGVGKDALAHQLAAVGWCHLKFAGPMKAMALALDPLVADRLRLTECVDRWGWERAKRDFPEVRRVLQALGTEGGRAILGNDVWVNATMAEVDRIDAPVVLSDVRFPNEAQAVEVRGGAVVRIHRPFVSPLNAHSSETALDGWRWAAEVVNDGSPGDMLERLGPLLSRLAHPSGGRRVV